jgi:hypothetical protein
MANRFAGFFISVAFLIVICPPNVRAQDSTRATGPVEQVYATVDGVALKAHVFRQKPPNRKEPLPAIVLFHGGAWSIGEPAWAFGRAEHFAARGMVAVAAQYRLSNQSTITPLEAMADARAVIRWMRSNAASLGIDPNRIAAYGWFHRRFILKTTAGCSGCLARAPTSRRFPRPPMFAKACRRRSYYKETWIRSRRSQARSSSATAWPPPATDASFMSSADSDIYSRPPASAMMDGRNRIPKYEPRRTKRRMSFWRRLGLSNECKSRKRKLIRGEIVESKPPLNFLRWFFGIFGGFTAVYVLVGIAKGRLTYSVRHVIGVDEVILTAPGEIALASICLGAIAAMCLAFTFKPSLHKNRAFIIASVIVFIAALIGLDYLE